MRTSDTGIALIKKWESCRLQAYQDQRGIWTIGYGHTGAGITENAHWRQTDADMHLLIDLRETEDLLGKYVSVPLNQNQFDALVSLVFNIGIQNFRRSTLRCVLNKGQYEAAAAEFVRWDKETIQGVLHEAQGLLNRRTEEEDLFCKKVP